ncbi:unnamed protein product [Ambrosiozyma monospora]|uniref:Unnamed protein product n=1 Tax=Ambrosiozyma monospora TaxID=43982 RepID=A0ACB5TNL7_AMBMO|nr:unnamed protein product [Ambrosiozyma monospora]
MMKMNLQAFITHKLKVEKSLQHINLVNSSLDHLKEGKIDYLKLFDGASNKFMTFLKNIIDDLITDGYIQRDREDSDVYLYIP